MVSPAESRPLGLILLFIVAVMSTGCGQEGAEEQTAQEGASTAAGAPVEYVTPDPQSGTSAAAVVGEEIPLAHTTQLLPLDESGNMVGAGSYAAQTRQVLDNIESALQEVEAGMEDLVKLNVYATSTEVIDSVRQVFGETFTGSAHPTVMYVETGLPHTEASVAMDAVAAAPSGTDEGLAASVHSAALYGQEGIGHVSVLPPGERVYIAGQAERGEDVVESTALTMKGLHETLDYLGLDASNVVQVKGFMRPMSEAPAVREEIASFYTDRAAPSIVLTEWTHGSYPIEIEMIAAADTSIAPDTSAISYITPPGMSKSDVFSRVAQVHRGDPVYISGLYGDPGKDAAGQIRDIFQRMDSLLTDVDSDFRHLAKATYYVTSDEASDGLGEIRPDFYDPQRPPAASLAPVPGIGKENAEITIDMIGVTAP